MHLVWLSGDTLDTKDSNRTAPLPGKTAFCNEEKEELCEPTHVADAVPAKSLEKKASEPVSRISGWLTAISLAGVLAGAGFIARFSREQFLGISLGDWNVQDLSLLAGRCGIDSLLLPLAFLLRHGPAVALCLLVPALAAVVVHYQPRAETPLRACGLVAVIGASCVALFRYEAPTIQLNGWVIPGVLNLNTIPGSTTFQLPNSYIDRRYEYVSKLLIASRLPTLDPRNAEMPVSSGNVKVPILSGLGITPGDAGDDLQIQYSLVVLLCLASWIYLSIVRGPDRSTLPGRILYRSELVILVLLVVVSLFVPYMYGKLISSTEFAVADISYKESAPNSRSDKDMVWSDELFLISTAEKDVSVLSIKDGVAKVVQIPRDHLLYLHVYGRKDILRDLLEQRAALSSKGGAI
jgi:hypothetical protein